MTTVLSLYFHTGKTVFIETGPSVHIKQLELLSKSHYSDVIMSTMMSQITSVSIVCWTICSGADQIHKSSASLAFVRKIHRWPVDSPHKGPVTRKMFPIDDVIMHYSSCIISATIHYWPGHERLDIYHAIRLGNSTQNISPVQRDKKSQDYFYGKGIARILENKILFGKWKYKANTTRQEMSLGYT